MVVAEETPVGKQIHPNTSSFDRFKVYVKMVEGWGKVRRYYYSKFRRNYIERMKKHRRGECARCGSCCNVMFKCPHLKDINECLVYEQRADQCGHFPIDHRDLRFREDTCGYHFVREES